MAAAAGSAGSGHERPRYSHLVGTEVEPPLTGRRIPIVADRQVA